MLINWVYFSLCVFVWCYCLKWIMKGISFDILVNREGNVNGELSK